MLKNLFFSLFFFLLNNGFDFSYELSLYIKCEDYFSGDFFFISFIYLFFLQKKMHHKGMLTIFLLNLDISAFASSADSDQLASEEAS